MRLWNLYVQISESEGGDSCPKLVSLGSSGKICPPPEKSLLAKTWGRGICNFCPEVCPGNVCRPPELKTLFKTFGDVGGRGTEQVKTGQVNLDHLTGHFRGHFRGRLCGTLRGSFRGESVNRQSLVFSDRNQLSQAIPQFHVERVLHQRTPIARFESQRNDTRTKFCVFRGRYDRQRMLVIRIAAMTLASPKGPNLEKIKSRLKCSISLENFNLAWKFQSRPSEFPTKNRGWWVARLKISISLENFSRSWKFSRFGPLGSDSAITIARFRPSKALSWAHSWAHSWVKFCFCLLCASPSWAEVTI